MEIILLTTVHLFIWTLVTWIDLFFLFQKSIFVQNEFTSFKRRSFISLTKNNPSVKQYLKTRFYSYVFLTPIQIKITERTVLSHNTMFQDQEMDWEKANVNIAKYFYKSHNLQGFGFGQKSIFDWFTVGWTNSGNWTIHHCRRLQRWVTLVSRTRAQESYEILSSWQIKQSVLKCHPERSPQWGSKKHLSWCDVMYLHLKSKKNPRPRALISWTELCSVAL